MTSKRPEWAHVERKIPAWWSRDLTDADLGFVTGWEEDGRRPGLAAMPTIRAKVQEDLDMGFVPREALHRALTGHNLDGNPVDRAEDQAMLQHYLDDRDAVVQSMGGLPSIAPKEMKDYYRSYIDGLLMSMDNRFRDAFFGRTSIPGGRTWIGADTLGELNNLAIAKAKATMGSRELKAHQEGFARGVRDYQGKIAAGYTRRAIPGWEDPRQPDALAPLEAPLQMLYEDLYRNR